MRRCRVDFVDPVYSANEDEYIAAESPSVCIGCLWSDPGATLEGMMRERSNWKLTLAYDGSEFHGWQVQPGRPTIQGALAAAVATVTGESVLPQGSGRTDTGVHACGQVASLSLEAAIPAENLQRALNRILPASIRIRSAERAPAEFHARHSTIGKIYEYRIFHGRVCPPFLARYVTCWRWPLDLEAMQQGAEAILGEHDFTSFAATDPDRISRMKSEGTEIRSNVRRIEQSQWRQEWLPLSSADGLGALLGGPSAEPIGDALGDPLTDHEAEMFTYTVRGNGFLHHMVRNLVGTLLDVGRGRVEATEILRILDGRDRRLAGPTAPANGLCLMQVLY